MELRNAMLQANDTTEKFMELIEEIVELPDENLDQNQVDMILGMINGALTPKMREESILAILEEMKKKSYSECKEMVEEMNGATTELINELGITSPLKQELIHGIFGIFSELTDEAFKRLEGYDTVIHFQLVHPNAKIPTYAHDTDAGADVYAPDDVVIAPGARGQMVDTGFKMAMAPGWYMAVCPRSGLSYKTTMRIANTPGTIDCDYRDNVGILIDNLSDETIVINAGDRIAQFVLHPVYRFKGVVTEDVNQIGENRGGGFGSTGN
jgi:dUTP pyrophosphatase